MKTKAWSPSSIPKKKLNEEEHKLLEESVRLDEPPVLPPEMDDDPANEWRKVRPGQDETSGLDRGAGAPARDSMSPAPRADRAEGGPSAGAPEGATQAGAELRNLLGEGARGIDESDLAKVVDASDVEKASAMGLTPRDVSDALQELQSAAVAEGRSADSVDSLVALEALVTQERVLEDLERSEPGFDRQALSELSSPLRERESTRDEPDEAEKAEREMEMDAD